ncbi:MAG: homoserine dehydrogenase [Oscillospiraceae bacterium]|jgi:homoserine dehydrogenase|nr:homoserine dehydrogenase [Oscillospiraceae bacterium]
MDLAIMGYGVVGSGVAQLLHQNYESIVARSMQPSLRLKYILDLRAFPGDPYGHLVIRDVQTILEDPEVGIVVETMGGLHPAFAFVLACLEAGKSVVTSNKELVAAKGYELLEAARAHNVNFLFEASVGGGIPILRPLSQCLAANKITEVAGILNGTTNFILTRMFEDDMPFPAALRLAQENGYAEKDPTADIEGHDACRKICILAALAFGRHVYPEQVRTEGISSLRAEDVACASAGGFAIKLLGRAVRLPDGRISATVAPALVPHSCLLANVSDVYNAILVRGDAIGDVIFYGRGAGKLPTASAVVADIIDCGKHVQHRKFFGWDPADPAFVAPAEEDVSAFYIRTVCALAFDLEAAKAALLRQFPGVRWLERPGAAPGELAFLLPPAVESEARAALAENFDVQPETVLRVIEF